MNACIAVAWSCAAGSVVRRYCETAGDGGVVEVVSHTGSEPLLGSSPDAVGQDSMDSRHNSF